MKKSPVPCYNLLEKYKKYNRVVYVQTTRGCPHDCDFCAATKLYGPKYRHKNVEQVVEEIKLIKQIFGKVHINFADDNMFVNKKFSKELLEAIIPLKIKFMAQTDVSIAKDEPFLKLLKKAGCNVVAIGFESVYKEAFKCMESE